MEEKEISFREIILKYPDGQNPCGQNPNDGGNTMGTNNYGSGSVVPYNMNRELYPMHGNAYFDFFPPGYRFKPSNEELVVHYLRKKILNERLPPNRIEEVELYKRNPQDLAENYTSNGDNEWYFFTPRDRRYKNGQRPNRSAGDGYWKATGADRPVNHKGVKVGSRKALVFYQGKPPNGDKTYWIMHEFTVANLPRRKKSQVENDMRLDDWVLCRLYKNSKGPGRARDSQVPDQEPKNEVPPLIQDREKEPKVEESNMLPQENFLAPFEQMYSSNYQANPMGLYYYDNSPFLHGCQSSLSDGSEFLYTQPWQNPTIHHMVSGHHQNPMLPPELFSSADNITHGQLNDYHSGDFSNILPFSDCPGASTSVISQPNDAKKLKTHL